MTLPVSHLVRIVLGVAAIIGIGVVCLTAAYRTMSISSYVALGLFILFSTMILMLMAPKMPEGRRGRKGRNPEDEEEF